MSKLTDRKTRKGVKREGRPSDAAPKAEAARMRTPIQIVCQPELKGKFSAKCDEEGVNASEMIRETSIIPFLNGTGPVVNLLTLRLLQVANVLVDDPEKAARIVMILEGKK